jgi:hypothetical protein
MGPPDLIVPKKEIKKDLGAKNLFDFSTLK